MNRFPRPKLPGGAHRNYWSAAAMGLLFATALMPIQVQAQPGHGTGPGNPACVLLGMLNPSAPLPPHCSGDHDDDGSLAPEVLAQLDQLQMAVLPFFSYDVAIAAGWDTAISPCVELPGVGGMGYHIANMDQLQNNGGHLSLLRPEVLMYVPTEDGSMQFGGVEYIIPAPAWPHDPSEGIAPEFLGQDLHYNPEQDIWALHVWVGKTNPAGVFEDWNPDISCEFAPPPPEE